jgi:polysaccharide export outer membrane protein
MKPSLSRLVRSLSLMVIAAALLPSPGRAQAPAAATTRPAAAPPAGSSRAGTTAASKLRAHILQPTEKINVTVAPDPDLTRLVTIDEKGNVDLRLIGQIKVADLTIEDAEKAIAKAYVDGRFLRRPQVSIALEYQVRQTVRMTGQFKTTGDIQLPADTVVNIVDVVMLAGGFTDVARSSAVSVTRVMPDGTQRTWEGIDVEGFIRGRRELKDALEILPNDMINVGVRAF